MVERFLSQTSFSSQEDFIKNLKINVPEPGLPNNLTRTLYFGQMTKAKVANSHLPT